MSTKIIKSFHEKKNNKPLVFHLYHQLVESAIDNCIEKKVSVDYENIYNNFETGSFLVMEKGKKTTVALVSDDFPNNKIEASIAISDIKKHYSSEVRKANISTDSLFFIKKDSSINFITLLMEIKFKDAGLFKDKNSSYENRSNTMIKNAGRFMSLSTYIDDVRVEHPISIGESPNDKKLSINESDFLFVFDADTENLLYITSFTYNKIISFENGAKVQDVAAEDEIHKAVDEVVKNILEDKDNTSDTIPTEFGNKIKH